MSTDRGKLLSIQSHVVSGYVGNRAATFPLQTLGYDVDVINTVNFSNHTGYGLTKGSKTTPETLNDLFDGLASNGLACYPKILSGYVPSATCLSAIHGQLTRLKKECSNSIYLLDPVMGDIGLGLYVASDVVPIYRQMLSLATIITPNQFELEILAQMSISTLSDLRLALHKLHKVHHIPHIVVSSFAASVSLVHTLHLPLPPASYTQYLPDPLPPFYDPPHLRSVDGNALLCFASTYENDLHEVWAFALPTIRGYFSGVGDLFSALTLAHFDPVDTGTASTVLLQAVGRSLLTVQQILLKTHLYSLDQSQVSKRSKLESQSDSVIPSDDELDRQSQRTTGRPGRKAERRRLRELRVIAERALLVERGDVWPSTRIDWSSILE